MSFIHWFQQVFSCYDVTLQVSRLNSDLVDITALYQDWAEPYQLWECKLAILQCAGIRKNPPSIG